MSSDNVHSGACFCGAVEYKVTGKPAAMGYCHCSSCRHWSAGPVNAFSLWPRDSLEVLNGADKIGTYAKNPQSQRKWCTVCGGHLFTDHPPWNLVDVYAGSIPDFPFAAGLHVHYQETVLHIRDGLPKMKDMPAEMGGSGQTLPE
jgi:hypothetical protein